MICIQNCTIWILDDIKYEKLQKVNQMSLGVCDLMSWIKSSFFSFLPKQGSRKKIFMNFTRFFFSILIGLRLKFVFSKKATKINEIFTVDLTVTTYCHIDGEGFINFCGLLRKCERKRGKYLLKTSIYKYTIATSEKSSFIP